MRFFQLLLLCLLFSISVHAQTAPAPMIGFLHHEAAQYEAEWRLYTGYGKTLTKNNLQGALVENRAIYRGPIAAGQLYDAIKPFHAIVLVARDEGVHTMTDADRARALIARADLERYVREGGGLFLLAQAVRYPGDDDQKFHNLLFEPFGAQILREAIFDTTQTFDSPRTPVFAPMPYFWTKNITAHPTTQNVRRIYLPLYTHEPVPGVPALQLGEDWQVVVRGDASAKSYLVGDDNGIDLSRAGNQKSAPPIAAARSLGKGRVFIYSAPARDTFLNYGNKMWPQITEAVGDRENGTPSDSNTLLLNALRWISQPAGSTPGFGTHVLAPIEPIVFDPSVNWDTAEFGAPSAGVRGIIGAHSNYSDGKGSVAEYVAAAKAAGLSYIVFTDPLELLSETKLAALKADCARASSDDFYACPGVEFSDSLGVRWASWGEKVVWPEKEFVSNGKTYPVWNGKFIIATGRYETMCAYSPNAIIDYKKLRAANAHPANLWWFFRIIPLAYEISDGAAKPIADNFDEYLYALRDMRWLSVDSFTRLRAPAEVATAAQTAVTSLRDMSAVRSICNSRVNVAFESMAARQHVSQGLDAPRITQWDVINNQMENPWLITRGTQRVRLKFTVSSPVGIREVLVHDADKGIIRRFDGGGAKTFSHEWNMAHDEQHYLVLDVIDTNGKRAISNYQFLYCYKSGLYRCGDNLNTLGSAQLVWHPDRNQMPTFTKYFENGFKYTVQGIDSGPPLATQPDLWPMEYVSTTEGSYPQLPAEITNKIPDIKLGSTDLQIYSTDMSQRSEGFDTDTRPGPSWGAISKRLGPHPYFERKHITYAPRSRQDYFVTWNHRRPWEGSKNYKGSILWHEGEIRWTKSVTLKSAVPVQLVRENGPGGARFDLHDQLFVTDAERGLLSLRLRADQEKPLRRSGRIAPGGYCAAMNTDLGYIAFFAPPGSDFSYSTYGTDNAPDLVNNTVIGLGRDGQKVEVGEVWKYRFALATIADPKLSNELLKDISQGFNLNAEKESVYPVEVKTGKLLDTEYFCSLSADKNETQFSIGPRELICDLPIRISGLQDNGCAADWATGRNFFRFVPVVDGTAYFQESIDKKAEIWAGNVFVSDNPNVKLSLTIDGQAEDKAPLLEIHNPTEKEITTRVWSPPGTPLFGGMSFDVTLPAGGSTPGLIEGKTFKPQVGQ
jgi:hypothetical protein